MKIEEVADEKQGIYTLPGLRSKNRAGTNFSLGVVGIHQKE